ncbi:MAG TPA: hypothetical protein VEC57_18215 [Candidatus Limnocylindrales bacterium]|nr:hypothetical protein [Candidatus Limnocylindrales bacterium]
MTQPGQTLKALLSRPSPDLAEIAAHLDSLALADRIAAVRELQGSKLQGALWKAAASAQPVSVDDMVPPDYPRQRAVIFHGKNSLPAFTDFEKICFRPSDADAGNVAWGYNETKIRPVIGPGYYVLHDTSGNTLGGAAFDYTQVPRRGLPSWPPVKRNDAGITQFVYGNMIDYMRRVAGDVFIGSAVKGGKEMGSYFVVVRELLSV